MKSPRNAQKKPAAKAPATPRSRRPRGAKAYNKRIMPNVRLLLQQGVDDFGIAEFLGIEVETLAAWAAAHLELRDVLESREEIRKWDYERNIAMARELAKRGATDAEIAMAFNISDRTLNRWRAKHPEFDEALTLGQDQAIAVAERTLFQMATGFVYEEERIVSTKSGPIKLRERKRALPDGQMLRVYLAANKPDKYSAKPRPDGGEDPISDFARSLKERGVSGVLAVEKEEG